MQPIASTAEILYFKINNRSVDDTWVQWAIDMLEAGFDTEHLRILAGEMKPFNQFYLHPLTDKVFKELGIDVTDEAVIVKNYICFLINGALTNRSTHFGVLGKLHQMYYELDYDKRLSDFHLLYYAKQDLLHYTEQWDWPDATRKNIDAIIHQHFVQWQVANCAAK